MLTSNAAIVLAGVFLLGVIVTGNARDQLAATVGSVLLTFLAGTWWLAGTGVYLLYATPAVDGKAKAGLHTTAAFGLALGVVDLLLAALVA